MGPEGLCKHPVGSLSFNWRYLLNEILVRLALGGFAIGFNQIKPFEREVYAVEWYNHYYPYVKEEVFPESIAAIIFASCLFVVPVTVLALFIVWKQLPRVLVVEEAVNFFLGVSFALESDFVINELVKNTYGRPRPDYLSRCFGNDKNKWPEQNITLIPPIPRCTNPDISYRTLLDGRRSFPSAHTSLSFTVYGYLALFLYRKLCQIKNTGSLRLFLPTLILSFALYIGITRTQDYRHFPTDVIGGIILGSSVAFITWTFYDNIMEYTYQHHRHKYIENENIVHDPFNLKTPPAYLPVPTITFMEMKPSENV